MIALTAVRAGEARGARWDEIDMEAATWTIPASTMKAGREFSVTLEHGLDARRAGAGAGSCPPKSSLVFPSRTGGPMPKNAPGRVLSPRRSQPQIGYTGSVRARGRGWPSPASRQRSRRPASPMSREAKSFRRISGPTCWSAAPRFSRYGANTSSSETPSEKACLHTYSRRASSAASRAIGRCRPPPQRPQQNPVRIDGDGPPPPGRLIAMWR